MTVYLIVEYILVNIAAFDFFNEIFLILDYVLVEGKILMSGKA